MSNYKFVLATAKILRVLYESSAINSQGQFCNGWQYRCRNLVDELAYFTTTQNGILFVCHFREAKQFCKFSERAWLLSQDMPEETYLRQQKGPVHGEHIVPISLVQKIAFDMLEIGMTDRQLADMLTHLVEVVFITKDEQKFLDFSAKKGGLGLKTSMPDGWDFDVHDHDWSKARRYSRLEAADIKIASQTKENSLNMNDLSG
ncbi:MAG: hypothetical protein AAF609_06220 [Cyanobacteria bacterium P01_C01_bin.120]